MNPTFELRGQATWIRLDVKWLPTLDADGGLRRALIDTTIDVVTERGASVRDRVFAIRGLAHGVCDLVLCGHARVDSARKAEASIFGHCKPLLDRGGVR